MTRNTEPLSIEQVKELLRKATPGPWQVLTTDEGWMYVGDVNLQSLAGIGDMEVIEHDDAWTAKLMAAAPDLARLCLSLAAQLQQAVTALEKYADHSVWGEAYIGGGSPSGLKELYGLPDDFPENGWGWAEDALGQIQPAEAGEAL